MNLFLDSSVILDAFLKRHGQPIWPRSENIFCSQLVILECHKVADRYRLTALLNDEYYSNLKMQLNHFFESVHIIELTPEIFHTALQTFPTPVGTLDALHLAAFLILMKLGVTNLRLFTYDKQMKTCAKALGIDLLEN